MVVIFVDDASQGNKQTEIRKQTNTLYRQTQMLKMNRMDHLEVLKHRQGKALTIVVVACIHKQRKSQQTNRAICGSIILRQTKQLLVEMYSAFILAASTVIVHTCPSTTEFLTTTMTMTMIIKRVMMMATNIMIDSVQRFVCQNF